VSTAQVACNSDWVAAASLQKMKCESSTVLRGSEALFELHFAAMKASKTPHQVEDLYVCMCSSTYHVDMGTCSVIPAVSGVVSASQRSRHATMILQCPAHDIK